MFKIVRIGYRSTVLLALGVLLFSSAARAMEIWKFDKMADADQDEYVADLVVGAQKVLKDDGNPDLAKKARKLFLSIPAGDKISVGMGEFEINLARARVADLERVKKDPSASRLEVEHAMIVTLKKNDIVLPKSFMTVGKEFKPKHPPKEN
jgi:hypothetical protein